MKNFYIKLDLRKKIVGFECSKCSTVTCKYTRSDDTSITINCPKCQTTENFKNKPLEKGKKYPLQWLFS